MPGHWIVLLESTNPDSETRKIHLSREIKTGADLRDALEEGSRLKTVEIYQHTAFVQLSPNDHLSEFGNRILRLRISDDNAVEDDKNTSGVKLIQGRYLDWNGSTFPLSNTATLKIKEESGRQIDGTGVTVWDGALLLAHFINQYSETVAHHKIVVELGAGVGLVGLVAAACGAKHVVLTDLPYCMTLLQENIRMNRCSNCITECQELDWFQEVPANLLQLNADVILVADCVWVHDLVQPLLNTLRCFASKVAIVYIAYQRRGLDCYESMMEGLHQLFHVETLRVSETVSFDCNLPEDKFFLFRCTYRSTK